MAKWSMQEAENAVKAAFFSNLHEGSVPESLRYTQLRRRITEGRTISDRTLARALKILQEKSQLRKVEDGGYQLSPQFERKDREDVIVASDRMSIDAGLALGVVGSQDEGWSFYGVPLGKPRELRPQLRQAAIRFQEEVDGILREQADLIVERTLGRARRRGLPSKQAKGIRRILMDIFEFLESLRVEHLDSFSWVFVMEKIAPGSFPQFIQNLLEPPGGIRNDIQAGVPIHQSMANRPNEWIPYLARMFIEDEEAIKAEWSTLLAEAQAGAKAYETLRSHLTATDWKTFGRQWSSILNARYWLCAVIR